MVVTGSRNGTCKLKAPLKEGLYFCDIIAGHKTYFVPVMFSSHYLNSCKDDAFSFSLMLEFKVDKSVQESQLFDISSSIKSLKEEDNFSFIYLSFLFP